MTEEQTWVPAACTLPTAEQPTRVAEFDGLFAAGLQSVDHVAGSEHARFVLTGGDDVLAHARDLAARESECCSFFTFDVHRDADSAEGVVMDVTVAPGHVQILDGLVRRADAVRGLD